MNSLQRLLILISGSGSNMRSLVQRCYSEQWRARIVAVISSRSSAAGLTWANAQGIPAEALEPEDFADREAFDIALSQRIDIYKPDYILLAGFMRVLTPGFVHRYFGQLINIHPSLLPAFPGLSTHRRALAAGVQTHGCTVHFVTTVLDSGPIIAQGFTPVLEDDTELLLANRVLKIEHQLFPIVVRWLIQGKISIVGKSSVCVRGTTSRLFTLHSDSVLRDVSLHI